MRVLTHDKNKLNQRLWVFRVPWSPNGFVLTGPSTKCYFNESLFMRVLTYDKNKLNRRLWVFRVPWSPNGFVLNLPPRGGFWKHSKWPWNMIHSMPCRDPCRLYIHLAIHMLCWSLKRSIKRTWTGSVFSTNESAWSVMVTGSWSQCEVALTLKHNQLSPNLNPPQKIFGSCDSTSPHFNIVPIGRPD